MSFQTAVEMVRKQRFSLEHLDMNYLEKNSIKKLQKYYQRRKRGNYLLLHICWVLWGIGLAVMIGLKIIDYYNAEGIFTLSLMIIFLVIMPLCLMPLAKSCRVLSAIKKGNFYLLEDELLSFESAAYKIRKSRKRRSHGVQRIILRFKYSGDAIAEYDRLIFSLYLNKMEEFLVSKRGRKLYLFVVEVGRKKYLEDMLSAENFILVNDVELRTSTQTLIPSFAPVFFDLT